MESGLLRCVLLLGFSAVRALQLDALGLFGTSYRFSVFLRDPGVFDSIEWKRESRQGRDVWNVELRMYYNKLIQQGDNCVVSRTMRRSTSLPPFRDSAGALRNTDPRLSLVPFFFAGNANLEVRGGFSHAAFFADLVFLMEEKLAPRFVLSNHMLYDRFCRALRSFGDYEVPAPRTPVFRAFLYALLLMKLNGDVGAFVRAYPEGKYRVPAVDLSALSGDRDDFELVFKLFRALGLRKLRVRGPISRDLGVLSARQLRLIGDCRFREVCVRNIEPIAYLRIDECGPGAPEHAVWDSLRVLRVEECLLPGELLLLVERYPRLRELYVVLYAGSDESIEHLAQLLDNKRFRGAIRELDLRVSNRYDVSGELWNQLLGIGGLRRLFVHGDMEEGMVIPVVTPAFSDSLVELWIRTQSVLSDSLVASLRRLRSVERLTVEELFSRGSPTLRSLLQAGRLAKTLRHLAVRSLDIDAISGCGRLESLALGAAAPSEGWGAFLASTQGRLKHSAIESLSLEHWNCNLLGDIGISESARTLGTLKRLAIAKPGTRSLSPGTLANIAMYAGLEEVAIVDDCGYSCDNLQYGLFNSADQAVIADENSWDLLVLPELRELSLTVTHRNVRAATHIISKSPCLEQLFIEVDFTEAMSSDEELGRFLEGDLANYKKFLEAVSALEGVQLFQMDTSRAMLVYEALEGMEERKAEGLRARLQKLAMVENRVLRDSTSALFSSVNRYQWVGSEEGQRYADEGLVCEAGCSAPDFEGSFLVFYRAHGAGRNMVDEAATVGAIFGTRRDGIIY